MAPCPSCGIPAVKYCGREGSTESVDIWKCAAHGTFTTPAR